MMAVSDESSDTSHVPIDLPIIPHLPQGDLVVKVHRSGSTADQRDS